MRMGDALVRDYLTSPALVTPRGQSATASATGLSAGMVWPPGGNGLPCWMEIASSGLLESYGLYTTSVLNASDTTATFSGHLA